jgi:hypothetical protein
MQFYNPLSISIVVHNFHKQRWGDHFNVVIYRYSIVSYPSKINIIMSIIFKCYIVVFNVILVQI